MKEIEKYIKKDYGKDKKEELSFEIYHNKESITCIGKSDKELINSNLYTTCMFMNLCVQALKYEIDEKYLQADKIIETLIPLIAVAYGQVIDK